MTHHKISYHDQGRRELCFRHAVEAAMVGGEITTAVNYATLDPYKSHVDYILCHICGKEDNDGEDNNSIDKTGDG